MFVIFLKICTNLILIAFKRKLLLVEKNYILQGLSLLDLLQAHILLREHLLHTCVSQNIHFHTKRFNEHVSFSLLSDETLWKMFAFIVF